MTKSINPELHAHVDRKLRAYYVQRADDRQKAMGLSYTTAETSDLAEFIVHRISEDRVNRPFEKNDQAWAVLAHALDEWRAVFLQLTQEAEAHDAG